MSVRILLTLILFFLLHLQSFAQHSEDITLIFSHQQGVENSASPTGKKKKRIIPHLFKPGFLIFKTTLYPQLGMSCYFKEQCTEFCGDLIEEFGLFKGYFISFDRIVRCNRFAPLESYPSALSKEGKVIEQIEFYQNP